MIPLILFVLLGIAILIIFEVRARKEKNNNTELQNDAAQATDVATEQRSEDDGCCGSIWFAREKHFFKPMLKSSITMMRN